MKSVFHKIFLKKISYNFPQIFLITIKFISIFYKKQIKTKLSENRNFSVM